jgi:hypothetical protein
VIMDTIINDFSFTRVTRGVKPDTKKRVVLPKELVGEDVIFHIYANARGQILLDPQVTVPASEAWLFKNPEALALIRQGLDDASNGNLSPVDPKSL